MRHPAAHCAHNHLLRPLGASAGRRGCRHHRRHRCHHGLRSSASCAFSSATRSVSAAARSSPLAAATLASRSSSRSWSSFFVSFNQADRAWATWIAWVLEEAGYSVFFQDWDFRGNFVEHMNRAHAQARRTLAVLSDNYFGSDFTLAEWSARFAQDPAARDDRLVPVKVGPLTGERSSARSSTPISPVARRPRRSGGCSGGSSGR